MRRSVGRSAVCAVGAMTVWAAIHSLLATTRSKRLAERALGTRANEGLYRLGYNGVAVATTAALAWYLHRLPDRTIYRVRGTARLPLPAVRGAMLLVALRAAGEIGMGRFSGLTEALAWATGRQTFPAPEAQGPAAKDGSERGVLKTGGPFRYVRHPLNGSVAAIAFLTPTMTVVRLTVAAATLLYAVLGSKLEERRLLAMYGDAYQRYRERVPFLLPRLTGAAVEFEGEA